MMRYRKFAIGTVVTVLVLLLLWAAMVYMVDPLYQYHKPLWGYHFDISNERYQNAGFARNFDYDAAIIGSSMTENFKTSWFDTLFTAHTVKLPFSGGRCGEYNYLLQNIFQTHSLRYLFFGLDLYTFVMSPHSMKDGFPVYLYDKNPFNDVKYLLNKEMFLDLGINYILKNVSGNTRSSFDDAYAWYQAHTFSIKNTLESYRKIRPDIQQEKPDTYFLDNVQNNLDDLLKFIKDNPDTEFYIFFPPYSILFWELEARSGNLEADFTAMETLISTLLRYDNVSLFYFLNIESIVTNLNNYKDYTHYNIGITEMIAVSMAEGRYQLTLSNYQEVLQKMRELISSYDFEALF